MQDSHSYHFVSRRRVEGTCGEVADVLGDPGALAVGAGLALLLVRPRRHH